MTKPLLSICIATYNRAEYIGETLESIIPQLTQDAEIVIVDGASTDGTRDVIQRYTDRCPQIHYIRLASKGGVDQDYCQAVEKARGEYCWLFPDDDLFKPNAVRAVLNEIPKGYSLIVVNAQVMNKDFSMILEDKRLRIEKDEIFLGSQMDQFFNRAVTYMSFIGSIVIKHDLWAQRAKEPYWGTEFIHVGVIFQSPLPAPALVMAEPLVTIRYGNAQWTPRAVDIWMNKWPDLLASLTHISERTRKSYQKTFPWRRLKKAVTFRALGAYSLKEYQHWVTFDQPSFWFRVTALVTAVTTACVINLSLLFNFLIKTSSHLDFSPLQIT